MTGRSETLVMADDGRKIAVEIEEGIGPTVVWLGGFRSDMTGSKAEALAAWGRMIGRRIVRFDYSAHGRSEGDFIEGRISRWAAEAQAVIAAYGQDDVILVGSSMGGWMALLAARAGLAGLKGMVLVAPAPDFTQLLMLPSFSAEQRRQLDEEGKVTLADDYGGAPTVLSRAFFEDAESCLVLGAPIALGAPVHILQGMADATVPHSHAMRLVERLAEDDVVLTLVKDGDHRLSRPADIDRLIAAVAAIDRDA